ncbi:DTX3L [Branchiostoma lanceolatum]|nr:DTX3L [Branchiostoma lanceolatum]
MMSTQAIVTFKSHSNAMEVARKEHTTYNGTDLTVEPYIEVFSTVTAVIPASLRDHLPNDVIDRLENKTGVQVNRNSRQNNTLEITGSLHEIEQAQKMLRKRFATIIHEELVTGSQPQVSISSKRTDKYNHNRYMDNHTDLGQVDVDETGQEFTSIKDSNDRDIKQSYQTNGLPPDLAEDRSKDGPRNGRSRPLTRKIAGRSSSLSRLEGSTRTDHVRAPWDTKEGPADIIGKRLDNRSNVSSEVKKPHTQPVLSSKSPGASKPKSSAKGKLKTPSVLPSRPTFPSTQTGGSITGSTSKSSRSRLQGGVCVSTSTQRASRRRTHSVHHYRGVNVSVVHGDLTEEIVDVIVSSAGGDMKNHGGVAGAISRAGGPSIQEDCDRYRRRHGPLNTTDCMVTGPGRLPCSHVIHVAGPVFQSRHPFKTEEELKETTFRVLTSAAVDLKAQSIALPAISSGTFRVPKDMCARSMLAGIMAFAETQREICSDLGDIRIVDNDFGTVLGFTSHCEKLLDESSDRDSKRGSRRRSSSMSRADRRDRTSSSGHTVSSSNTSKVPAASGAVSGATTYGSSYNHDSYQSLPSFLNDNKGDYYFRDENDWDQQNTPGMEFSSQAQPHDKSTKSDGQQDEACPICMSDFTDPKTLPCKHKFCAACLATALKHAAKCPICGLVVGRLRGDQPDGKMECVVEKYSSLPGYPGCGTIIIHYDIPSGIQGPEHPNPGHRFHGTSRKAYLPCNPEGQEVLTLLKEAWKNKLVFTIGTSVTTGTSDAVTWNDIHHKTNRSGGPTRYGYPDPTYLGRVKEELAAKGITPRPSTA